MNKQIDETIKYGIKNWTNTKMTAMTTNDGWTLSYTATYPSRVASGALYVLFGDGTQGTCELYVDNSTWIVTLANNYLKPFLLTKILPMIGRTAGYYRNGTGCTVTLYRNGTSVYTSALVYTSGITLPSPIMFDTLKLTGFYGGYQADDLCHDVGALPLVGYQF